MLELDRVNTWLGRAHTLHDVTFDVGAGEVVALLGRNGAGKTTTLRTVIGLTPPASGTVRFAGDDLTGRPVHQIAARGIAYVPEDRRIFTDLTVEENLSIARRPGESPGPHWTRQALFELFPNLAERRRNFGGELSGGEQQMLTIARALMGDPLLLLLDEPSQGIAPVIVDEMIAAIAAMRAHGLSVLLSEQNLSFVAALASRAVVLESGAVRYTGPLDQVLDDPALRDAYLAV